MSSPPLRILSDTPLMILINKADDAAEWNLGSDLRFIFKYYANLSKHGFILARRCRKRNVCGIKIERVIESTRAATLFTNVERSGLTSSPSSRKSPIECHWNFGRYLASYTTSGAPIIQRKAFEAKTS